MWALLDYDGKTVVAAIPPSVRLEDVADEGVSWLTILAKSYK